MSDPAEEITPSSFDSGSSTNGPRINAVQLALVEAHGRPGKILTNSTCCDPVSIESIKFANPDGTPAGELNDWIIHSCEVVYSRADTMDWAKPWWGVFLRARNVVGYRTVMIMNDLAMSSYGAQLGIGTPIIGTWLNTVMSLKEYEMDRFTNGADGKLHPVGRPSTISVCGHDEDSVLTEFSPRPPECLIHWWVNDTRPTVILTP